QLEPLVLEMADGPGGQLLHVYFEPREIAGSLPGDGAAIAAAYRGQLERSGVAVRYGTQVRSLEVGPTPELVLATGDRVAARALLVATGARRRRLEVPGARELEDKGVTYSATRDRDVLAGRVVGVLGGGDAACENALNLADAGCDVTLIARAGLRARREVRERVAGASRVRVLEHTRVLEVVGGRWVTGLRLAGPAGESRFECSAVVVKLGVVPNSEWCRAALPHDEAGYLRVDGAFATPVPGVWAA